MKTIVRVTACSLVLGLCCLFTACAISVPTLINQITIGVVGGINLAAALNHTVADQTLVTRIQNEGSAASTAYNDWIAAAATAKPDAWSKVQVTMNVFQKDAPAVLQGFGVNNPAYLAVADFVISEVETLSATITGTSPMSATSKRAIHVSSAAKNSGKNFKSEYNKKMTAAGHPEFNIK